MNYNPLLDNLDIYEAGKPIELVVREYGIEPSQVVKLASNENPRGVSPKVQEAVSAIVGQMYRYPDDSFYELKDALSHHYGVESNNIVIGSGSDQVLEFICHARLRHGDNVVMNKVTFAMYEIYAKQFGAKVIRTDTLFHDTDALIALCKEHNPAILFVCVPCNPVGDCLPKEEVYRLIENVSSQTLIVIDGAYMEYASYKDSLVSLNPSDLICKFPNVIYLGTFSKAYGLGGMRVGYGIAQPEMIRALHKVRPPFNITTLSLKAAIAALDDQPFMKQSIIECYEEMMRYEVFAKENNLEFISSFTNFLTLYTGEKDSTEIFHALMKKGVIVRNLAGYGLNAIRITVGTKEQNERFFYEMTLLLKDA